MKDIVLLDLEVRGQYFEKKMHANKEVIINAELYSIQIKNLGLLNDFQMAEKLNIDVLKYRSIIFAALGIKNIQNPDFRENPPMYAYNLCTMYPDKDKCALAINLLEEYFNELNSLS